MSIDIVYCIQDTGQDQILGIRHVLHSCTEKEDTSESGVSP